MQHAFISPDTGMGNDAFGTTRVDIDPGRLVTRTLLQSVSVGFGDRERHAARGIGDGGSPVPGPATVTFRDRTGDWTTTDRRNRPDTEGGGR